MLFDVQTMYDGLGEYETSGGKMVDVHDVDYTLVSSFGQILEAAKKGRVVVLQFTGLLDKNGNEIYEGDITNSIEWEDKPREVIFWEGCFCHKREDGNGHIFNPKKVEIIGNVWENPELIK